MTTTSQNAPSSPSPSSAGLSTCWVPLDDLTQRWATLGASASTSHESTAVGAAFAALAQERLALRQVTLAAQADPCTLRYEPLLPLWSEGYSERESGLEALLEAISCWLRAACALDEQAGILLPPHHERHDPRLLRVSIQDALFQRARLGHLVAEVLEAQVQHYQRQVLFNEQARVQRGASQ